jgi:hypothetical protein
LRASTITLKKIQVASKPSERFIKAQYNKLRISRDGETKEACARAIELHIICCAMAYKNKIIS